ncbi:MAG: hypothetical protein WAL64_01490 [Candidatus Dormiibacterota bacterium]
MSSRPGLAVVGKGFIRDARKVVSRLSRLEPLDEAVKIRMRVMTRELQDDSGELTASRQSPALSAALARPVSELARAVLDEQELDTVHSRDRAAIAFLAVIQILEADASSRTNTTSSELAQQLLTELEVTHDTLGAWLRVSPRTIQRWVSKEVTPSPEQAARLQALARIVEQLRFVYPPRGINQFLQRPVERWSKRSTVQILDDEELVREAEEAVRRIRG